MIRGLFRYYPVFTRHAGRSLHLLVALMLVGGLTEGVGLVSFLPFLDQITQSRSDDNPLGRMLYGLLNRFGVEPTTLAVLLLILGIVTVLCLVKIVQEVLSARVMAVMLARLREKLLAAYASMEYGYYLRTDAGYLSNVLVRETDQMASAFGQYALMVASCVYLVVYVAASIALDWTLFALALVAGGVLVAGLRVLANVSARFSTLTSAESGRFQQHVTQFLHYFKYLKATHTFPEVNQHIDRQIEHLSAYRFKLSGAGALVRGLSEPIAALLVIVLLIVQTSVLQRPVAAVLVMMLLFHRIMQKLMAAQHAWNAFCGLIGSVDMFGDTLSAADAHREPRRGGTPTFARAIELRHVNVSIGSASILNDISLTIPAGATIGITGESGAGKSTLVDVITGLLKPTSGEVLVDGVNLQELDLQQWRRQIGYVVQENVVFQDSIANNIALWRSDGPERAAAIDGAIAAAQLEDLVRASSAGLSTTVGDRGIALSVGQRQRLALARELFKHPQLLILDEATSALDSRTEEQIQRRTDEWRGRLTLVMIAHRLSTIRNCDYVYVLSKGGIVERGTWDDLMAAPNSHLVSLARGQLGSPAASTIN